jgi:hypothetical protein
LSSLSPVGSSAQCAESAPLRRPTFNALNLYQRLWGSAEPRREDRPTVRGGPDDSLGRRSAALRERAMCRSERPLGSAAR